MNPWKIAFYISVPVVLCCFGRVLLLHDWTGSPLCAVGMVFGPPLIMWFHWKGYPP